MIAAGQNYQSLNFDWTMNNPNTYAAAAAFGVANVYGPGYDAFRTPNSSGSDDSMNDSRTNPKLSPKYREKRMKNNEAAKKSRAQRKQREMENVKDNTYLRQRISEFDTQMKSIIADMEQLRTTIKDLTMERDSLKCRLEVYEQPNATKFPLRELKFADPNGSQNVPPYFGTTYQNLA